MSTNYAKTGKILNSDFTSFAAICLFDELNSDISGMVILQFYTSLKPCHFNLGLFHTEGNGVREKF